ncbi:helix-turn-helix transcriptional regulator [Symbioplanes lichenis]|uniref:helix-turn-helix transcriptional regulator n=1 Tax=Symbioplanes lichenis TaxID=1629072 RepID=UPI00273A0934|nr:LuxR family transcriptional regulator [Actinoplanes lichenis]
MATRLNTPLQRLTGRDRELRLVRATIDHVRAGQLTVLLLTGPSGSGRSRMLLETADASRHRGYDVVTEPAETPRTASTLVVCSDHPHRITPADWDELDRLAESVPVLVALTARPGHNPLPPDRLTSPRVQRVDLSPLSPAAAGALAADLLSASPDALSASPGRDFAVPGRALADLLRVAAGRPRVIHDLIRGLQEEGLLSSSGTLTATRLPARTLAWIRDQLAALSPQARHLAHAATTLKAAFPLVQLTRPLAVHPLQVVPAIAELLDSGLLTSDGELLTFTHDLVRRAVAADLPRPIAAALREEPDPFHPAAAQLPPPASLPATAALPPAAQLPAAPAPPPTATQPPTAPALPPTVTQPPTLPSTATPSPTASALPPAAAQPPTASALSPAPATPREEAAGWASLSPRERQIAILAGQALTNQQIATRVGRSPHTVNFHLRQIFHKLGIVSRVELAALIHHTHP